MSLAFVRLVGAHMRAAPVVLVVEDDSDVRRVIVEALENDGMTVIDAASGQEALRVLRADSTIGVLVSDVMMPGISGAVLVEQATAFRPGLKTLLLSAYAPALTGTTRVIEKPIRVAQLCAEIRALSVRP
jgi:CheY-like chemotaxis protein